MILKTLKNELKKSYHLRPQLCLIIHLVAL